MRRRGMRALRRSAPLGRAGSKDRRTGLDPGNARGSPLEARDASAAASARQLIDDYQSLIGSRSRGAELLQAGVMMVDGGSPKWGSRGSTHRTT